jgi:hypothetical protein
LPCSFRSRCNRPLYIHVADSATAPPADGPGLFDEHQVLARCSYFVDVQLWPREQVINPQRWLDNFLAAERPYAAHLLGSFQYFSTELTDALLTGAFQDLSRRILDLDAPTAVARAQWTDFCQSVLITYPTGELPNPTDSGYLFARKARQVLRVPEQRILSPESTLTYLLKHGARPVVFVDDFLGSGNQFRDTWVRRHTVGGIETSFKELQEDLLFEPYYVPVMATASGSAALVNVAPAVTVAAAHELPEELSALHDDSVVWPESERAAGQAVVQAASLRAGFPDTGGNSIEDWQGFAALGLSIAFAHSVPDATLPIFHAERDNWFPLVRRT